MGMNCLRVFFPQKPCKDKQKLKTLLNLTVTRLAPLRIRRQTRCAQAEADVAQLLLLGHKLRAHHRAELLIKDRDMIDVLAMVESYCHLLTERSFLLNSQKECPQELREAASGLVYASLRCGDLPELREVRRIFSAMFGKEFTFAAAELRNSSGVDGKMVHMLSTKQPSLRMRVAVLKEIAIAKSIEVELDELIPETSELLEAECVAKVLTQKNFCESWMLNVELHNIRDFSSIPDECASYVGKYMTSSQYKSDVGRVAIEASRFLTNSLTLGGAEGKDAWVFDVDDTLISTVPFFKDRHFGAIVDCRRDPTDRASLEEWMATGNAPVIEDMLSLFNEIKGKGVEIVLISWRSEQLRAATVHNLFKAGYNGWSKLILRCDKEGYVDAQTYKSEQRKKLVEQGYRLWGIVGSHWSSLTGHSIPNRTFKLPNPMYYL